MDPNNIEIQDQNQNQGNAPRKRRSGCLVRAAFLCLIPFLLGVVLLVVVGWVQAHRTLPEPRNFRPSPLVLAALQTGNGTGQPQPATGTTGTTGTMPDRADVPATSGTVISGPSGTTVTATSTVIAPPSFELIPESELARSELREQARQINASFRQWADVMRLLYAQGWVKFQESPQANDQPFGQYPQYGYWQLEEQLAKTSLAATYRKTLADACLQLLVHYGDWETASNLCFSGYNTNLYSWEDTLYALRQIPKPLVKYPRIVVWTGMRQVFKVIQVVNRRK